MPSSPKNPKPDWPDERGGAAASAEPVRTQVSPRRATESAATLAADDAGSTAGSVGASHPRPVDPTPASLAVDSSSPRYEHRRDLGEGGMGVVRLLKDAWIGREVAMKVMRAGAAASPEACQRFVREVRVQGQLEHPSIVPVHDIGVQPDGSTFFTMKRIKGHTLADILDALRAEDTELVAKYPRHKLLSALSQVCVTVAFAHSRGVVHRDLKPENVMLGDFGEVYVLDWGVAKIAGVEDRDVDLAGAAPTEAGEGTRDGSVIGTPGYASPEQVCGDVRSVGPQSDVYALGAILFEILTLSPLHSGSTITALVMSTMKTEKAVPSASVEDVPPELDAICSRSAALEREARFGTALELHESLERFLGGERDAELRKELAKKHVEDAQAALAAAAAGDDSEANRQRGMRSLGAALALEPTNDGALRTITEALLEAPSELPPEAERELLEVNRRDRALGIQASVIAYVAILLAMPIMMTMGIRSWTYAAIIDAVLLVAIAYSAWMWVTGNVDPKYASKAIILNFAVVGLMSSFFGPLVLVPGVAAVTGATIMVSIRANRITRRGVLLLALGAVFAPFGLQLAGVIPHSYAFEDGALKILPLIVEFTPGGTIALLLFSALMIVVSSNLMIGRAVSALIEAERRNFARAWQLRALLPKEAQPKSV